MTIRKISGALLIGILMTSCCLKSNDYGYVQREWSLTLQELGITPVFPPREDVMVGDIFAYTYNPTDENNIRIFTTKYDELTRDDKRKRRQFGMSTRLARLAPAFNEQISNEYKETLSAPSTTAVYNTILGNPAIAAANDNIKAAEGKLKKLQDAVAKAEKEASDTKASLLQAKRKKEDADKAVQKAEAKLNVAKSNPPDTKEQENLLKAAKNKLRLKEDSLTEAERILEDAGNDTTKKEEAIKGKTQALREKEDAALAVKRAQEDLNEAKQIPVDVSTFQADLETAKNKQEEANADLTAAVRHHADKSAAATAIIIKNKDPLEKAKKAVEGAKAIRDAIAKAGAKMLYTQPQDAKLDVYNAKKLPNIKNGINDLLNSRVNRLRLVAFPDFATTSFTQGNLAALIPVEALLVGLNISSTNVSSVSVKVPAAESYALSLDKVIKLTKQMFLNVQSDVFLAAKTLYSNVNQNPDKKDDKNIVYLCVLTEVFYARAMDITLFAASSFGARTQISPPVPVAGADALPSASPTVVSQVNSSVAGSATATNMLSNIQKNLSMTQTVPGGSVQVVNYNDQSIGLRRVFDRPIAIGTRGLVIKVDLKSGKHRFLPPIITPMPKMKYNGPQFNQ